MSAKIKAFLSLLLLFCLSAGARAAKLAIVIDDFGYRPHEENQVLAMPTAISIAVLPNAPYATEMARKAHAQGRQILIHLPMEPLSKQPLERDTLRPDMSQEEIARIVREAVNHVPYAVGLNNHMGSAMTSSLSGMRNVMQVLSHYPFYFLDSMTIGDSQSRQAAAGTGVRVIKRDVFLDDTANEADIRRQFNRAVALARRRGSAIAIGHPHPNTVKVLQQMLRQLPPDIELVPPSALLNEPQAMPRGPRTGPMRPYAPFRGIPMCLAKHAPPPVYADAMFKAIFSSLDQTPWMQQIKHRLDSAPPRR
ncbi:divergent polysaccharide deacetylase family protein [Martelella alba]|uniref:Divergent polysaccharide deacetylase family protein n=1 Tax=Martelella alba TaxID=2590451 RepID=A0ABY2SHD7_9HYPH|nr:divergent polysaccharide deacetylase family protein [Martelella alba]TKI04016.1 divergent polysaccharide deacetylase family protein [Martelella alba]